MNVSISSAAATNTINFPNFTGSATLSQLQGDRKWAGVRLVLSIPDDANEVQVGGPNNTWVTAIDTTRISDGANLRFVTRGGEKGI